MTTALKNPVDATAEPADGTTAIAPTNGKAPRGRPASKRLGIREIARRAEVSVATVSLVLNDNDKITKATRAKVQKVMDEVGYRPNRNAQSLSGKYSRMLAVLMPTLRHALADPYFGELISGICDKAARLGHNVMLESAKPEFIKENRHIELIERRFVDGVLCLGFNDRHDFLTDFLKGDHPMVAVNSIFPQWGVDHVIGDYQAAAQQVMTYLLQLGHERIGLIHGSPDVRTNRMLMEAYDQRVAKANLGLDESYQADGRFTEDHGAEAAKALLDQHPRITALFACNDKMAIGALHYLAEAGKRVPEDVSVIGFDDIRVSGFVNPSLSTVRLPLYEAGTLAAERLIERIRGKTEHIAEILPAHLVLRDSTGIAPRVFGERRA